MGNGSQYKKCIVTREGWPGGGVLRYSARARCDTASQAMTRCRGAPTTRPLGLRHDRLWACDTAMWVHLCAQAGPRLGAPCT